MSKIKLGKLVWVSKFWMYYNESTYNREKVYFKVMSHEDISPYDWKVLRLTVELSRERYPSQDNYNSQFNRTIGYSEISLKTMEMQYLQKHQYKNTMNPITREEFIAAQEEFKSNFPNYRISLHYQNIEI